MDKIKFVQKKYKSEMGESMGKPYKKLKRTFIYMGVTGAVYGGFRFLLPLVIPFFIAWGIAVLLRPSATWISDHLRVRITICKKQRSFGVAVGAAGMAELLMILAGVLVVFYCGIRRCAEEAAALSTQVPVWIESLDTVVSGWCRRTEACFQLRHGLLVYLVRKMLMGLWESVKEGIMPFVVANSMTFFRWGAGFLVFVALDVIAVGLSLQEMDQWNCRMKTSVYCEEIARIRGCLSRVINAGFKTQVILLMLISGICMVAFWIMKNPYYILAGLGTGILDALPILGAGAVLIPWMLICFLCHQWQKGIFLFLLYLVCYFLRQILEPRLMGKQIGITPLEELIAMFVGLRLFGIRGIFLGPLGLLLIRELVKGENRDL
ncbi:MAG: AI-2E family transporter [Clostridiales bacterium]|nr:AI-2E family transporter [Clostridiales bacterium]